MKVFGFTIEELRQLMATRSMLLKMLQSSKADQEVIAWVKRKGSAEVIRLDDFRTEPGRDCRLGRARRARSSKRHATKVIQSGARLVPKPHDHRGNDDCG